MNVLWEVACRDFYSVNKGRTPLFLHFTVNESAVLLVYFRYEEQLKERESQLQKEDLSDMVAEHAAKQKVSVATWTKSVGSIGRGYQDSFLKRPLGPYETFTPNLMVLSSCTGALEPIQKAKQYSSANQWLLNKENAMVNPLWTVHEGRTNLINEDTKISRK